MSVSVLASPSKSQERPNPVQVEAQQPQPALAPAAPTAAASGTETKTGAASAVRSNDPQKQCVKTGEFAVELKSGRNPVGGTIVFATNFLPTNQRVDVGVRAPFVDGVRYFAGIDYGDETYLFKRQDVVTRRAVDSDPLVKKHFLEPDQAIVTLNMGDDFASMWNRVDLYLYTCNSAVGESPGRVSLTTVRLSPYWLSIGITVAEVFLLYVWIAFALRTRDHTLASFVRTLDPARLTAGPDGKGSLSTFQTLSFSLVVVGLISLLLLQTGMLTDISGTILTLLGISGIGATVAKGADAQRNTLSADNRAWLLRRGWIPMAKTPVDPSNASWRDFFSTDGVFDVYRYQSFIFALVVIGALIAAGVTQLSTFVIPDTILGIVGLSQVVYIGGKLVTPTNMSDLNAAIAGLRTEEAKFKDAATAAKQGPVASLADAINSAGPGAYAAYREKAKDVAAIFTAETGIVVGDASLDPALA
ncbi:hypothetical protein [Tardiphaga sp.]|uniref:hypothetical protein n=1 Tax=Tardiphaga sp. TaxID=1926292 RepID=UPI00261F3393|nr:hypothetical protein [Tardiphaga sp.]